MFVCMGMCDADTDILLTKLVLLEHREKANVLRCSHPTKLLDSISNNGEQCRTKGNNK